MDPHQIRVTLYRQAAVIFAVPLICGILIALCVISVMTNYLDNPPSRYLGVMIGIYAAFDWLFYEATVHVMVRMVDSPASWKPLAEAARRMNSLTDASAGVFLNS